MRSHYNIKYSASLQSNITIFQHNPWA